MSTPGSASVADLGERRIIADIRAKLPPAPAWLPIGIGDDAAVIATTAPAWWHLTTDLLAEGIHFDLKSAAPESVGYRAAMANLSDIAAMGAVPRYLLVALAIPKTFKRQAMTCELVRFFEAGIKSQLRRLKAK